MGRWRQSEAEQSLASDLWEIAADNAHRPQGSMAHKDLQYTTQTLCSFAGVDASWLPVWGLMFWLSSIINKNIYPNPCCTILPHLSTREVESGGK